MNLPDFTLWLVYFAVNVFGTVSMKIATGKEKLEGLSFFLGLVTNIWGIAAVLAWSSSALLLAVLMKKNSLLNTASISALNYGLIAFAAVIFLGENFSLQKFFGVVMIAVGIYIIAQK